MKCIHYFITYDQRTPKGCKIYGIQSQKLPSQIIKDANDGKDCIGFKAKPEKMKEKTKNLNDDKYWN